MLRLYLRRPVVPPLPEPPARAPPRPTDPSRIHTSFHDLEDASAAELPSELRVTL